MGINMVFVSNWGMPPNDANSDFAENWGGMDHFWEAPGVCIKSPIGRGHYATQIIVFREPWKHLISILLAFLWRNNHAMSGQISKVFLLGRSCSRFGIEPDGHFKNQDLIHSTRANPWKHAVSDRNSEAQPFGGAKCHGHWWFQAAASAARGATWPNDSSKAPDAMVDAGQRLMWEFQGIVELMEREWCKDRWWNEITEEFRAGRRSEEHFPLGICLEKNWNNGPFRDVFQSKWILTGN